MNIFILLVVAHDVEDYDICGTASPASPDRMSLVETILSTHPKHILHAVRFKIAQLGNTDVVSRC